MARRQIARDRRTPSCLLPSRLDSLNGNRPLAVQLIRVPLMTLLFTVLQALALVVFEHAVLTAVVAIAEAAVADDGLCAVLAVLEGAADLLWGHAAAEG
jgi:hypothetical protein